MQLLWPSPDPDADPVAAHLALEGGRPTDRRWIISNMASSLDGAVTIDGRSGSIGGPGDRAMFRAVRALADTILVGAGTVRAENYRPTSASFTPSPTRSTAPGLAIVSGRLDLDPDLPCLSPDLAPEDRATIYTAASAPPERREMLSRVATVVDVGKDRVDLGVVADRLHGVVVCEGGPVLLGQLAAADLVDEWFVTVGGVVAVGDAQRIAHGPDSVAQRLEPVSVAIDGADVFLHHVRSRRD